VSDDALAAGMVSQNKPPIWHCRMEWVWGERQQAWDGSGVRDNRHGMGLGWETTGMGWGWGEKQEHVLLEIMSTTVLWVNCSAGLRHSRHHYRHLAGT